MPDQINPSIGLAEDTFKTVVWDSSVSAALVLLGPFNVWPINFAIRYFTDKLYQVIRLGVDFQIITFKNQETSAVYSKAAVTLKALGQSKGYNSQEYLNASEAAKDAYNRANDINI